MIANKVLVLGLGRFGGGIATVRHLASAGHRVRIADKADPAALRESVAQLADLPRLEFCLGREDEFLLDGIDLLVCNPAVPPHHPLLVRAANRGVPITQEANLFLESYPGRVVLVTGTNGKSSTATLLAAMLRRGGVDTLLGGNIGHSLLADADAWRTDQVAVLEISSFQLERVDPARHRVAGALFTRVTADHLDRHGTVDAYHAAKARAAAMADAFVVRLGDDAAVAAMARTAPTFSYGTVADPVRVVDGACGPVLWSDLPPDQGPLVDAAAMRMTGGFQLVNAAGAYTAATRLGSVESGAFHSGVDRHRAGIAAAGTAPLPHRLQLSAAVDGIRIFDNGVSTHVESTLSALGTLASTPGRVHWVGGGKSKDGRFAEPGQRLRDHVATAHLFGSAARPLAAEMAEHVATTVHEHLEDALDAAWTSSRSGDAILFSPAFSSFDQFPNFAARADRFHAWVRRLQERRRSESGSDRSDRQTADARLAPG